jgi:hypothetical protein
MTREETSDHVVRMRREADGSMLCELDDGRVVSLPIVEVE